jgi:hypothetical protein
MPIIKARAVMRMQPPIPNTLGELEMMCVMLANATGSVASSNLSSIGVNDYWKGVALG